MRTKTIGSEKITEESVELSFSKNFGAAKTGKSEKVLPTVKFARPEIL